MDGGRLAATTALLLAAAYAALAGCNALSGLGDYAVVVPGAGAGGSGPGGAGQGGTGGCSAATDCPDPALLCETAACDLGVCGSVPIAAGEPSWQQTKGDCRSIVCDASGSTTSEPDALDLPDDGKDCTVDSCASAVPSNAPAEAGTSCDDDGGKLCDGAGNCVECITGADCPAGICQGNLCVPASCADGAKNGTETDTDCGGAECGPCPDGFACVGAADCVSEVCVGGSCQVPTCGDAVSNGGETGVDCGGPCAPCADGGPCGSGADCQSAVCVAGVCQVPNCADGAKNGGESAVDCGGPCPPCGNGSTCNTGSDCQSALCIGGTCNTGLTISIDGHAPVVVNCSVGDYNCQAQQVCNLVTGYACIWQDYDCYFGPGSGGSWYPPDGQSGSSNFNFAVGYDVIDCWGNICDCSGVGMATYGLAASAGCCNSGHWYRQ